MNILAIDLGGTSAKIGLIKNEKVVKTWQILTNTADVWGNIKMHLIDLDLDEVDAIGLSTPGFIDHKNGIIKLAGNLNWKDYDVKKDFVKYFNKPVYVLNDANAAALGEFWQGAGKAFDSIVMYTIGTGIGGGLIINGKLVYGKDGYAGELGHGGNFQSKWACTCGLKHCVEPVSSATGITKSLKEGGYNITVKEAGELIDSDPKVRKIFKDSLTPLGMHISTMQCALNPDAIIIGGGPSNIGEPLRKIIQEVVDENQLDFITKSTKIVLATTKNDAGMLGAAYWAIQNHEK